MEWSWTVGMGYFSLLVMMLTMLPLPLPVFSDNVTTSDALALLAFKSTADTNSRLRYTTTSVRYHCWWRGVQCSSGPRGRVIRFVLEGVGLKGTIGEHTLTLLDQLRVLSLKNNSLTGPIPDLSSLHNLKALFLSHNSFVGSFPPSILSLRRIQTVDLSHNNISGIIPTAAGSAMQNLHCFLVQNNRLWGSLPPFNQSTIKIFNVSTNAFSGPVPVTLFLLGLDSSALSANPDLCGRVVHRECAHYGYFFKLHPPSVSSSVASASPTEAMADDGGMLQNSMIPTTTTTTAAAAEVSTGGNKRPGKHKKRTSLVAGFMVFIALAFGIFGLLLTMRKKRHKPINKSFSPEKSAAAATDVTASRWEDDDDVDACNQNLMTKEEREREGERYIQDGELAAATSISEQKVRKLGKSGCLVFCAGEASMYSLEQLMKASAEMLGRGKIGSTYKAILDNRLIVSVKRLDASKLGITAKETFDRHMDTIGKLRHPNLISLRAYFQAKEERLLVYDYQSNGSLYSLIHGTRSKRAKPLHWTSCLKIAEDVVQGLAYIHQASRLVHGNLKSSNVLLGADFEACITDNCLAILLEPSEMDEEISHKAPEARTSNRHLTPKSDIYSFGVLLLELLTGKPSLQSSFLAATDLPVWVRSVREENGGGGGEREDERLMMLVDVADSCLKALPENRPTTWQVLKMIQELKDADLDEADVVESL